MSNEELGTTLEERMIAEEYKIWKKNTPCKCFGGPTNNNYDMTVSLLSCDG